MFKAVRSLGAGARGHSVASCECPEQADRDVATPGCQDVRCVALSPGPWDPVTLSKEGANSGAAAAVIVEREEQHRERWRQGCNRLL